MDGFERTDGWLDGWLDAWLGEYVGCLFVGSRPTGPLTWRKARKPLGRGLWRGLISRKPKLLLTIHTHIHPTMYSIIHPNIRPYTHPPIYSPTHPIFRPSMHPHEWVDGWMCE